MVKGGAQTLAMFLLKKFDMPRPETSNRQQRENLMRTSRAFVAKPERKFNIIVRTLFVAVLLLSVTVFQASAAGEGSLHDRHKEPASGNRAAQEYATNAEITVEPEPTTACCAAACIGGGTCGIYCEEITSEDPCESKYRFDCSVEEGLICQGGSCICAR
jgi:hypothetical protein